jgi:hypothetical protein
MQSDTRNAVISGDTETTYVILLRSPTNTHSVRSGVARVNPLLKGIRKCKGVANKQNHYVKLGKKFNNHIIK